MSALSAAVLEPRGAARIALESVEVQATLGGLLSEVTVTQTYRNLEQTNIEAVYTFPLPLGAVLLGLTLELGGRTLQGVVQARKSAQARYEQAVEEGDSSVLLEQVQHGIFTLNLANLLPGETARIRFRYAQLHHWQGERLRFHLPTTLAPRYGDPLAAGLEPHQVPETVLDAEHGFSLTLRIEGPLARADFECPSHPLIVQDEPGARILSLSGGSRLMDRDFVLVLREPHSSAGEGLWARDGEGTVVLGAFHPRFAGEADTAPRCVKLVVDCSGSMAGDSIAQARRALLAILDQLRRTDSFNLILFGSTARALWPAAVLADGQYLAQARAYVEHLDADLGGTEIGQALELAYQSRGPEGMASDLLLITDGEVWNPEPVIEQAARSGHRIFSVGVGSAVSEAFVRQLAERTGGACELVSPREDMAERIVRHFRRIHQPRARSVRVSWPGTPIRQIPERIEGVYAGDTLHLFAWLSGVPEGDAVLEVITESGQTLRQGLPLRPVSPQREEGSDTLVRMAARARLGTLEPDEAQALAVTHQLVTEQTSLVLVHEREIGEKAEGVPVLRKVPQVLAAGWGGMGSVDARVSGPQPAPCSDEPPVRLVASDRADGASPNYRDMERPAVYRRAADLKAPAQSGIDTDMEYLDIPAFLRRQDDTEGPSAAVIRLVAGLNARYPETHAGTLDIDSLSDLAALGLNAEQIEALFALVEGPTTEREVIVALLIVLLESDAGKGLSRHVRRLIGRAARARPVSKALRTDLRDLLVDW